ncbi:MAG: type I restriction enzyme HsdR N-terminal domain-containing protein [bacterium]
MSLTYKKLEEVIISGRKKGYFFISKDGSEIIYRGSQKKFGFKNDKEKRRAYLLVELIEKYHYLEKQIQMDVDIKIDKDIIKFDLLIYQNHLPYIVIDITNDTTDKINKNIAKLSQKALVLKARYAVLASPEGKTIIDLVNPKIKIDDIPVAGL